MYSQRVLDTLSYTLAQLRDVRDACKNCNPSTEFPSAMWLAPLFLLGLIGVGVPLWLHRFARQTEQKKPFASAMFLQASEIRRSRRHELRYWLVLLLRLLLIVLVVLAFAGPLWQTVAKPNAQGAKLHVIVMDTSMSMNATGVWSHAQQRAQELLDATQGSDRVMLVAADHRLRELHEPVFANKLGALRAAVNNLQPGSSRLDFGLLAVGSKTWSSQLGEQVVIHLISDLQRSGSPLRFADLQLEPGTQLDLVEVGVEDKRNNNLRITRITHTEPSNTATGGEVQVNVEGDAATATGRTLLIKVNGIERARKPLAARALPLTERFQIEPLGLGEHRLEAHLEPADALPQDDAYYSLLRRVHPKVLIVAASANGDDATYLRAALQSLQTPHFDIEAASASALAKRSLPEFATIIVSDAGLLDTASSAALQKYVENGGSALMTLGPRTSQKNGVAVSGAKLAGSRQRGDAHKELRIAEVEQSHPVLRDPGAWRGIRIFNHVAVESPDDATVLLRLENRTALLYEQTLGKGRLLVFASPLDRQWNDLAIHPLFVRFIAESTVYLAGARTLAATALVGSTFETDLARRSGGAVFDPHGKRSMTLDANDGTNSPSRLIPDMPGYYEIRGGGRSDFIAVNVDARESQLESLDQQTLSRWQALQQLSKVEPAATAMRSKNLQVEIWFWLLLAAAVIACIEPLVANHHLPILREGRL